MEWCQERGQHCWLPDCSFEDPKFDQQQQQEYGFWVSVWQQMPCEESNAAVVGGGEYNTWLPSSCARPTWNQEPTNDLLFWAGGADSCKAEDYCDPPMPTEAFDLVEEQQEDGFLSFKAGMQLLEEDGDLACGLSSDKALNALYATVLERAQALDLAAVTDHDISHLCRGLEQQQPDYPVPTFAEGNKCCAMSVKADQLKAAIEERAVKDEGTPSLHKNADAAAEQSIALAARVPHSDADDASFLQEFDARLDGDWVVVGRGGDHQPPAAAATFPPVSPLKPALKPAAHHHRPAPLRRPSNPPPATITEGPTPKNADDADQTCDNFRLFWEKDPALKTPKVESAAAAASTDRPAAAGAVPAMTKSVSFKDKKSAQCLIYVEPEKHVETEEEMQKLDDDRHTFDNFDRLWENDPHFIGMIAGTSSRAKFQDKIVHELEELAKSNIELLKVDASDMIQKHLVNIVNSTSSSSAKEETQKWCKSNVIYDPLTKTDRRFSFEFLYEIQNQNEEEGTADKTIRNAAVVLRCDVQVQVVLKVEPMQDPERKFLYNFNHNVKVLSDFKLETKARLLHTDIVVADEVPEQFREPGLEVTHHKVTNYISILHRWATVTTPRNKPSVLQRRMSASSSHSLAHQDLLQQQQKRQQQQQQQQVVEEQLQDGEGEEGTAAGGKALRRSRSRLRPHPYQQLQRSNSK